MSVAVERDGGPVPRLPWTAVQILEGLYQHRLLSTAQIRALFTPDSSRQWAQQLLSRIERSGLSASTRRPGGGKLYYLTPAGLDACETAPTAEPRRKLVTPEQAAGPLQHHTLAVNDVGVAFVQAARSRGDVFGPLAWRHEIAHPIGRAPGRRARDQLIADAYLTYERHRDNGATRFDYRFLELDRNTMPVGALAEKIVRYARLYDHMVTGLDGRPIAFWQTRYSVFPALLLVLDGGKAAVLRRRRDTVLALCAASPLLQRTPEVRIAVCLLDDLRDVGPFAGIWQTLANPGSTRDWLGQPVDDRPGESRSDDP